MRFLDRIIVLGFLLWLGSYLLDVFVEEVLEPSGPRPVPEAVLPRGAPDADGLPDLIRGRVAELPVDHPRRGMTRTGTAWQVDGGIWLSNRHVVENCDMYRLGRAQRPRIERLWRHPDADLVAFRSAPVPTAIALASAPPRSGARAIAVGYPRGQEGIVELTLAGSGNMRLTGALRSERPFRYLLWRVDSLPAHVPDTGSLGGISGGVVLDRDGRAIGVAFSSVPRRALVGTITFADTRRATDTAAAEARAVPRAVPTGDVRALAAALLRDGTVARVTCRT